MRIALIFVSVGALVVVGVATVSQALVVAQGIVYTPSGLPTDPTPLANAVTYGSFIGVLASFPACLASFALGLLVTIIRRQTGWVVAIIVAGLLALVGFFGMVWVLLSVNSPISLVTPLALVPLVTLLAGLRAVPLYDTPQLLTPTG